MTEKIDCVACCTDGESNAKQYSSFTAFTSCLF